MAGLSQRFYHCQLASAGLITFSDFVNHLRQTPEPTWMMLGIVLTSLAPSVPDYLWRISLALILLIIQELACKLRDRFEPVIAAEIKTRRSVGHSLYAADLVSDMIRWVQKIVEYRTTPTLSWQKEMGLLASLGVLLFGVREMLACSLLIVLVLNSQFFCPGLSEFLQSLIQTLDTLNFTAQMLKCGLETHIGDKRLKLQILLKETEIGYGFQTKYLEARPIGTLCIIWTDENHKQPIPSPDIYRGVEASSGVSSAGWTVSNFPKILIMLAKSRPLCLGPWIMVAAESLPSAVGREGICTRYRYWRQQYDINLALANPQIFTSILRPYLIQRSP